MTLYLFKTLLLSCSSSVATQKTQIQPTTDSFESQFNGLLDEREILIIILCCSLHLFKRTLKWDYKVVGKKTGQRNRQAESGEVKHKNSALHFGFFFVLGFYLHVLFSSLCYAQTAFVFNFFLLSCIVHINIFFLYAITYFQLCTQATHPSIPVPFTGASLDGINDDHDVFRYKRMYKYYE